MELDTVITDPAVVERLALLLEEAGEVIQIVGKTQRHGFESFHPNSPEITNRALLEGEIADFLIAVNLLIQSGDVSRENISKLVDENTIRKNKYLHNNVIK